VLYKQVSVASCVVWQWILNNEMINVLHQFVFMALYLLYYWVRYSLLLSELSIQVSDVVIHLFFDFCCLRLWCDKTRTKWLVAWPATSCFADWSKRRHVTLSSIEWSTRHSRPIVIIMTTSHVTFTRYILHCKRNIYSTLFLFTFWRYRWYFY